MRPQTRDLFGDVPVSHQDIDAWLRSVPRIEPGTRRAALYVQQYNVIEKIKAAKLSGRFDEIDTETAEPPPSFWLNRFTWTR